MARKITQNKVVTEENFRRVHPVNRQFLKEWLPYLRTMDRSDKTIENYKNCIEIILVWNLENNHNKPLYAWGRREIILLQDWLMTTQDNSPARVKGMKSALSSLCNFIEREYSTKYPNFRNVVRQVEDPVLTKTLDKSVFTEDEIVELLNKLVNKSRYEQACALALALYSGRRKTELTRFKVSDFTDNNLVCDGAMYKSAPMKTKGRGRNGKILKCYTLEGFTPYLNLWLSERERLGITSEYLLTDLKNPKLPISTKTLDSWAQSFTRIMNKDFYWHAVRHTRVTEFKRDGIPNEVIQQYIGWSTADMVNKYNDLDADEQFGSFFSKGGTNVSESISVESANARSNESNESIKSDAGSAATA